MGLPAELLALLEKSSTCYLATTMPDGSPQLTQVWVDTDGTHILVNTVEGHHKSRNIDRAPRVAVTMSDPSHPSRYHSVRGTVTNVSPEGSAEHIEKLSQRYLGRSYSWYGGRDQVRLVVIAPKKLHSMG